MKNKSLASGIMIIGFFAVIALLAAWISPYDPSAIDQESLLRQPSVAHWFGTDGLGRDILSRMIYGARISLSIGLVAVGIATALGLLLGAISGYYGGVVDSLIMRFVDIMLCFPTFYAILAVVAIRGPSIMNIMVIIGLTSWMGPARLIRGEILSLKEREFIQAARSIGASPARIIVRHLIPNGAGPVLVNMTMGIAGAILIESGLSFLGLGVQPPVPSWGNIPSRRNRRWGLPGGLPSFRALRY